MRLIGKTEVMSKVPLYGGGSVGVNWEGGRRGPAREGPAWAKAWRRRSVRKLRSSADVPVENGGR